MAKESRAKAAMGGKKSSSKSKSKSKAHKVHKMHIRHAANGGYIAEHEAPPSPDGMGMGEPNEEHALPDINALTQHVADHMGPAAGGTAAPPTPPAGATPPPQPTGGGGM